MVLLVNTFVNTMAVVKGQIIGISFNLIGIVASAVRLLQLLESHTITIDHRTVTAVCYLDPVPFTVSFGQNLVENLLATSVINIGLIAVAAAIAAGRELSAHQ